MQLIADHLSKMMIFLIDFFWVSVDSFSVDKEEECKHSILVKLISSFISLILSSFVLIFDMSVDFNQVSSLPQREEQMNIWTNLENHFWNRVNDLIWTWD